MTRPWRLRPRPRLHPIGEAQEHPDLIIFHGEGEVVTHGINWASWLEAGEAISTAQVESDDDLDLAVEAILPPPPQGGEDPILHHPVVQSFKVTGGLAGERWRGVMTITTTAGNILKASVHIIVKEP